MDLNMKAFGFIIDNHFRFSRLDCSGFKILLKYRLKRLFGLKNTDAECGVYEIFKHLRKHGGFMEANSVGWFVAYYPNLGISVKHRKQPSSDLSVFSQVYGDFEYRPVVEAFMRNFSGKSVGCIIDAGSNIGLASLFFSRVFPKATYIVIEPDDSNFELMSFNLTINNVMGVKKIKGALWSNNVNLKLVRDFRDKSDWAFRVEEGQVEESSISAFSLGHLIQEHSLSVIDVLKIDVEGSEKQIFTCPNSDVSFLKITKCIAIEIHDEFNCRDGILSVLESHGFMHFESGELVIGINQNLL